MGRNDSTFIPRDTSIGSDNLDDLDVGSMSLLPEKTPSKSKQPQSSTGLSLGLGDLSLFSGRSSANTGRGKEDDSMSITENRERHFSRRSGRFHDPDTGEFERGSAPEDLDSDVNRYRGESGRFKKRAADLYDEPEEVKQDSLEPRG